MEGVPRSAQLVGFGACRFTIFEVALCQTMYEIKGMYGRSCGRFSVDVVDIVNSLFFAVFTRKSILCMYFLLQIFVNLCEPILFCWKSYCVTTN